MSPTNVSITVGGWQYKSLSKGPWRVLSLSLQTNLKHRHPPSDSHDSKVKPTFILKQKQSLPPTLQYLHQLPMTTLPQIEPTLERGSSLWAKRLFIHACSIGAGVYIYLYVDFKS
jgi:hypothetical protein